MDPLLQLIRDVRLYDLLDANDLEGIRRFVDTHPEFLRSREYCGHFMHSAARSGQTEVLALMVDRGVDVNTPNDLQTIDPPLHAAVALNRSETTRWLIAHGSRINYAYEGHPPFCVSLNTAARNGNMEIVKMLVDAGAELTVIDYANRTPLTWAIEYGQTEVAEYLRSKGALEAHQVPGYVSPASKGPIVAYVESKICPTNGLAWLPIVPDEVPVSIHAVFDEDNYCLFTQGMSGRPMTVPLGGERYQYAELVLYLNDWDTDVKTWQTPDKVWAINWMRRIAQYPFEHNTWLGGKIAIIANEDPAQPLSKFTPMTCWLLIGERKPPLQRVELPDGRSVVFYTMMPLHTAERDFERKHGMLALLRKFEQHDTPLYLDPNRASVV